MRTAELEERLAAMIEDPQRHDDPLVSLCVELAEAQKKLRRRMERIGRISDTYQAQLRDAKDELEKTKERLEETLADLKSSYWHLKKIQEVLPVCLVCGKVRTGQTDWKPLLDYLMENSLLLSHGYCPDCLATVVETWRGQVRGT